MSPTVSQHTYQKRSPVDRRQQVVCEKSSERKIIRNTDTQNSEYFAQVRRAAAEAADEVQK